MATHGVQYSLSTSDSKMMRSSMLTVRYARQCYLMNPKTLAQKTSALPVVVAGCVWSTRPIACAIKVVTHLETATGGTLTRKGGGAGE